VLWYVWPGLKRKILIAFAVVAGLIAFVVVRQEVAYQRASYQGKSARSWALELPASFDPSGTNDVITAFKVMGSDAVPALVAMLNTRESWYAKLLAQQGRRLPITTRRYLFDKIKPGRSGAQRVAAARALGVVGPGASEAVPDLMVALQEDPEVRWAAAQALADIGDPGIKSMTSATTNQNAEIRHAAVYGLGQAGTNAWPATAALFDRVLDTNESVSASALYSLRRVGAAGVPVVLVAFSTEDPVRLAAAIKAIRAMNTPPQQILRMLLDYATNGTPDLRLHSLEALHALRLNHPRVVATYLSAMRDTHPGVRAAAARAMNQADAWTTNRALGEVTVQILNLSGTLDSNIVSALNGMLQDSDSSVRTAAQQTLANLKAPTTN
jgi:HEAT repeat protein